MNAEFHVGEVLAGNSSVQQAVDLTYFSKLYFKSSFWTPAVFKKPVCSPAPALDLPWSSNRNVSYSFWVFFSFSFDHAYQWDWLWDQFFWCYSEDSHYHSATQSPKTGPRTPLLVLFSHCWEMWRKFKTWWEVAVEFISLLCHMKPGTCIYPKLCHLPV